MLEKPLRHDGARVVTTASEAALLGRLRRDELADSIRSPGVYVGFGVYCKSKLANTLFAAELARRWPEVASTSYHPGAVASQFGRRSGLVGFLFAVPQFRALLRTPDQGADTMLWLAGAPAGAGWYSGGFSDRSPARTPRQTEDVLLPRDLWELSADLVSLPRT
ncbi:MAG: hypothetical protein ACR2J5_03280 [Geodermatophilaceae bacterium]